MSQYNKQSNISGKWAKASDIVSGTKCVLVAETRPEPSDFRKEDGTPKTRDVSKIMFEGITTEELNISLNRATINALVDAFGGESADWINKPLTCETEKMRVGGKAVTAVYLVPHGYHKIDDAGGYAVIVKKEVAKVDAPDDVPSVDYGDENPL